MTWTDDPLADFNRHDAKQQAGLDKLPKCDYCGQPIQDDHYFDINGDAICPDCLEKHFRKENCVE